MNIVIIPAFNEERNIESVIIEILKIGFEIIVINDGSTDRTNDILKNYNVQIINNSTNMGVGYSLKKGILDLKNNIENVIFLDADGAHNPQMIKPLLKHHIDNKSDITIGSRFFNQPQFVPYTKILANLFASLCIKTVTNSFLSDIASGMRIINQKYFKIFTSLNSDDYGIMAEMIISGIEKGMSISEYPIDVRYDGSELLFTSVKEFNCLLNILERYTVLNKKYSFSLLKTEINNYKKFKFQTRQKFLWMQEDAKELFVYGIPIIEKEGYIWQLTNPFYYNKFREDIFTLIF